MAILAIEHIVETPGVCGGKPRIDGTRMRVADVAISHQSGMSVARICEQFDLTPGQVHAALAYYYDHRDAIDQQINDADTFAKQYLEEGHASTSRAFIERMKQSRK